MKLALFLCYIWMLVDGSPMLAEKTVASPKTIYKNYDLFVGQNKIGYFNISKTINGNTVRYQAKSDANFRIIGKNHIAYQLDCTVKGDLITYSHCKVFKNGKLKDDTTIQWSGTQYTINKKGKTSIHKDPIPIPAIALYFDQPTKNEVKVFSEREACFKQFTRKEKNKFKLTPLGKRSGDDYTYENGELKEVVVSYVVTNFRTVLKP